MSIFILTFSIFQLYS